MAEQEACSQPGGLLLTGLLPNEAGNATRVLDAQRWSKLEERIAELIACIQPNRQSEVHRNAVAKYVQSLITGCNPCEVFTFGSVPLKTYLPDGDIDLTACSTSEYLKDTWGNAFLQLLENEGKSESAEFRVKEVHYIQAEVKIIKCLIENIIVDISFNQVGGLCTLCFLDEVDLLISRNHLFKKSIILIKAWCYYESRIIGAYFGLISTYALEILVLYIFHVFNGAFAGPFEVLYRFLEFFSNFDWDNFCVSIWGPVPISSLPDMTAELPRRDGGKLFFDKLFLEACSAFYATSLTGLENQGQQFVSKHLNIIDPLRTSNNLGRSVNKGNFRRIRSAFAFGAKKLAKLLDCPEEKMIAEVDQFFINTWKRHRSSNRPDVPIPSIHFLQPLVNRPNEGSDNSSIGLKVSDVHQVGQGRVSGGYASEKNQEISSTDHSVNNNGKSKLRFSRTRSFPELTRTVTVASSHIKHNRNLDTSKMHDENLISEHTSRGIIMDSEIPSVQSARFSFDDSKFFRQTSSFQCPEVATVSTIISNTYLDDSGSTAMRAGPAYDYRASQLQQQKGQDLVNITASSYLPLSLSPVLASTDYAQIKLTGSSPSNITLMNPSRGSGMQFFQNLDSSSNSAQKSSEEAVAVNKNSSKPSPEDDAGSIGGFETENEGLQIQSGETQHLTATRYNCIPTARGNASCTSATQGNDIVAAESSGRKDDHPDAFQYQTGRANDVSVTDSNENLTFVTSTQSGSFRRNHSSDTSEDLRVTQTGSDKWLRKPHLSEVTTSLSGNLSNGEQFADALEHISSSPEGDESGDFFSPLSVAHSYFEDHASPLASPHVRNQVPGYEAAQISVVDTSTLTKPVVVGSSLQMVVDNLSVSLAVDPVGPLDPFSTERSAYNFPAVPADGVNSVGSINQFDEDGGEQNCGSRSYQDIDIAKNYNQSEGHLNSVDLSTTRAASVESSEVLDGDFSSHLQSLQYGRLCQNTLNYGLYSYYLPVMVPSVYLQGYHPLDGSIRPSTDNINFLTQTMGYDPRLVQLASLQSGPSWSSGGYDRYENERPSFRPGTRTYGNPRPFFRDQRFSGRRNHRGHHSYVRVDRKVTEGRRINSQAQCGSLPDDRRPSDVNQTSRTDEQSHGAADRGGFSAHSSPKKPSSPHNESQQKSNMASF
ncbi:uncharacterized protein LOC110024487 isoform X2 [Phalaenopsis equestris]|uniref:uncharacterized protein LOC110024487 isoform X2 n=1 Tax=Phalaenopsis equestris TaxID=78828 RepID=UPI0009E48276|nr:uncharacterized protein LOC110024487 isoform X2 [Phalaenopsis equestris]